MAARMSQESKPGVGGAARSKAGQDKAGRRGVGSRACPTALARRTILSISGHEKALTGQWGSLAASASMRLAQKRLPGLTALGESRSTTRSCVVSTWSACSSGGRSDAGDTSSASHLRVEGRGIGVGQACTAAPQPPIGPCAALRLVPSA